MSIASPSVENHRDVSCKICLSPTRKHYCKSTLNLLFCLAQRNKGKREKRGWEFDPSNMIKFNNDKGGLGKTQGTEHL